MDHVSMNPHYIGFIHAYGEKVVYVNPLNVQMVSDNGDNCTIFMGGEVTVHVDGAISNVMRKLVSAGGNFMAPTQAASKMIS